MHILFFILISYFFFLPLDVCLSDVMYFHLIFYASQIISIFFSEPKYVKISYLFKYINNTKLNIPNSYTRRRGGQN